MSEVEQAGGRAKHERSTRRDVLTALSAVGAAGVLPATVTGSAAAEPDSERPKEGDLFVTQDNNGDGESVRPLTPADLPLGGPPVIVWPYDAAGKVVRKGSRLNKVLLVRLDPATLEGVTRERAAEGVVAYSAICPHAGCEVSKWVADQLIFECSCHYSLYNPRAAAAVLDGPAPRPLAALPLKIVDGHLAVAKPFTGRVGIVPA